MATTVCTGLPAIHAQREWKFRATRDEMAGIARRSSPAVSITLPPARFHPFVHPPLQPGLSSPGPDQAPTLTRPRSPPPLPRG